MNYQDEKLIEGIMKAYNPEFDCPPPDHPAVTWADYDLASVCKQLLKKVAQLEEELVSLREKQ